MKNKLKIPRKVWSYILLVGVVVTVFFVTLFPLSWHRMLYLGLFTLIYFAALQNMVRHRKLVFYGTLVVLVMNWASGFFDVYQLGVISKGMNILFFIYIVVAMVRQIALSRTVTATVIRDSIIGYLLIGMAFAMLVAMTAELDPASFNFIDGPDPSQMLVSHFSKDLYFAFITMATVGYGDMLPLKPFSRSLATIIGITGQLYIAIIIAMLVGKYASQGKS